MQPYSAVIESSCEHIADLRMNVGGLDARMAASAEGVIALHRKRRNLVDLSDRFAALAAVTEMVRNMNIEKRNTHTHAHTHTYTHTHTHTHT